MPMHEPHLRRLATTRDGADTLSTLHSVLPEEQAWTLAFVLFCFKAPQLISVRQWTQKGSKPGKRWAWHVVLVTPSCQRRKRDTSGGIWAGMGWDGMGRDGKGKAAEEK